MMLTALERYAIEAIMRSRLSYQPPTLAVIS